MQGRTRISFCLRVRTLEGMDSEYIAKSLQSRPTLYDPMDFWPWDSPGKHTRVGCHALLKGSSQAKVWTHISCLLHWQAGSLPLVPPGNLGSKDASTIREDHWGWRRMVWPQRMEWEGLWPQEPGSCLWVAFCMWLQREPRVPERYQYCGKWTRKSRLRQKCCLEVFGLIYSKSRCKQRNLVFQITLVATWKVDYVRRPATKVS